VPTIRLGRCAVSLMAGRVQTESNGP